MLVVIEAVKKVVTNLEDGKKTKKEQLLGITGKVFSFRSCLNL